MQTTARDILTTRFHTFNGNFNTLKWNCSFTFHLGIPYKHMIHVVKAPKIGPTRLDRVF
jgi:hypothetical protein